MVRLLRHRQAKEAETDRLNPTQPRHISTLLLQSQNLVSADWQLEKRDRLVWVDCDSSQLLKNSFCTGAIISEWVVVLRLESVAGLIGIRTLVHPATISVCSGVASSFLLVWAQLAPNMSSYCSFLLCKANRLLVSVCRGKAARFMM